MTDRLTSADWIAHGLLTLRDEGAGALKVGAMATALKVSRGSFYWHFRDIADFRTQILDQWQDRTTDEVIRQLDAESSPERLKHLLKRAFSGRSTIERAIRSWATGDREVAGVVASVDSRRIAYIAKLLTTAGVEPAPAKDRATVLYWAWLGQTLITVPRQATLSDRMIDNICELFES